MGGGSWREYFLQICHVGFRGVLRREEVAVTCNTTFKGREGAASTVGTNPIHVDGDRSVVQAGGAAHCARGIDHPPGRVNINGGVGDGGGCQPAASASLPVATVLVGYLTLPQGQGVQPPAQAWPCY